MAASDDQRRTARSDAFSRRRFLELGAGGLGGGLVLRSALVRQTAALTADHQVRVIAAVADGALVLARPEDQLYVRVEFLNLELSGDELVAIDGAAPSAVKLVFDAQHVAEQLLDLPTDPLPGFGDTLDQRAAAASRVVVTVVPPIPFTVESILDLAGRPLAIDPRATVGGVGSGPVDEELTSIGVPVDVELSPGPGGRFRAPMQPVTLGDVSELWRAELGADDGGVFVPASPLHPVDLRAPSAGVEGDGVDRILDQSLRQELESATTGYGDVAYPDNEALLARKLLLSIHGAWADFSGTWAGTGALAAYAEQVVSGRSVKVTVTERGYLAPFGHAASVVEVAERRFEAAGDGTVVAVLDRSESFIIPDGTVSTPGAFAVDEGRRWPFTDITIVPPAEPIRRVPVEWTDDTGTLRSISDDVIFEIGNEAGLAQSLTFVATDLSGEEVVFQSIAHYVRADEAFSLNPSAPLGTLIDLYRDETVYGLVRQIVHLDEQRIALAEEAESGSGATSKEVVSLRMRLTRPTGVTKADLVAAGQVAFQPGAVSFTVRDEELASLAGSDTDTFEVSHHEAYLEHGIAVGRPGERPPSAGNPRNEFLRLPERLELSTSTGGDGLVAPAFNVDVVGQDLGVSADLDATGGEWDPIEALGDANLLGVIPLAEILNAITPGSDVTAEPGIPGYEIVFEGPPGAPTDLCARLRWEPDIRSYTVAGTKMLVVTDDLAGEGLDNPFAGSSKATFDVETCFPLAGSAGEATSIEVAVQNVVLQVPPGAPALALQLRNVSYANDPQVGEVYDFGLEGFQFVGVLDVLEPFRKYLTSDDGFFALAIDEDLVDLTVRATVPDFDVGQLELSGINVAVGLQIPLPGSESLFTTRFSVGTVASPVTAGVWILRGSASFEIELAPPPVGITFFAASLGVGAEISASGLGVSGSVGMDVAASITYDTARPVAEQIIIGGVFSLHGEVKAWGVLGVGVEGVLDLKYLLNSKILRAKGEVTGWVTFFATKEWSVEVSEDFDLEKKPGPVFARARALPADDAFVTPATFVDAHPERPLWDQYSAAYD